MSARTVSMASALLAAAALVGGAASAQNPTGISWSTLFGGSAMEAHGGCRTAVATDGHILVGGNTLSNDLPIKHPFQATYAGGSNFGDTFVARLDPSAIGNAQLIWCTFLGGSADEVMKDVIPDGNGGAFVCGWTGSTNFPTTAGAYDTTFNGVQDAYVAHLAWDGQALSLAWSTFLGAEGVDGAGTIILDAAGQLFVAGNTTSRQFPIPAGTTPLQATSAGLVDGFVAVLDPSAQGVAQLLRSTYLGGAGYDYLSVDSFALDSAGLPVVCGRTTSSNFPTTPNAYDPTFNGAVDGFVSRLESQLTQLTYSTYLGGTRTDFLRIMAIAPGDKIAVAGYTHSSNFPTTQNAFDQSHNGLRDGFLTLLDTQQQLRNDQLVWSTFYGGSGYDRIQGLAVESCGLVVASGETVSTNLSTTAGAWAENFLGGSMDTFVARFDRTAQGPAQLHYATYLGGALSDESALLTLDASGEVIVNGTTDSPGFPTTQGAYSTALIGGRDMFITRLTMLPLGVVSYGSSTPACPWPIYQGVNSMPSQNNPNFAVHTCGAPANAVGAAFIGFRSPAPIPVFNIGLLINPGLPILTVPMPASTLGHAQLPLPLAGLSPGTQFALQWVFFTTMSCPGTGPFAASNGLEITV